MPIRRFVFALPLLVLALTPAGPGVGQPITSDDLREARLERPQLALQPAAASGDTAPPAVETEPAAPSQSTGAAASSTPPPDTDRDRGGLAKVGGVIKTVQKAERRVKKVTGLAAVEAKLRDSEWAKHNPRKASWLRTAYAGGLGFLFSGLNPVGAVVASSRTAVADDQSPVHRTLAATPPGKYLSVHHSTRNAVQIASGATVGGLTGGFGGAVTGTAREMGNLATQATGETASRTSSAAALAKARAYRPEPVDPERLSPLGKKHHVVAGRFAPILITRVDDQSAAIDQPEDPFRPGVANVLYDVKESAEHYFITYAIYHRADEKRIGLGDHANDMEGVTIAVKKGKTADEDQAVAIITLAHDEFFAHDLTRNKKLMNGQRPVISIEAGSHGIHAKDAKKEGLFGKVGRALDVRRHVRDQLLAKPADREVTFGAGGDRPYGLRPLTDVEMEHLDALFAGTPGNGAKTPLAWADRGRVSPGELYLDPESVFSRLVWTDRK